jgi:uncharacterized cupredoxin-like copper-binding protein
MSRFSAAAVLAGRLLVILPLGFSPAFADATVHVTLADVGGAIDFSEDLDLGVGGKGDGSHAPVSMTADASSVAAGQVTFEVLNNSKEIEHEMVVSALSDANAEPPFKAADNEVDEDAAQALGEVPELAPGKSGSVTLNLKPGNYVLFCNVAGHYSHGMWTKLEVK